MEPSSHADDFLLAWLESQPPLPHYSKFRHVPLSERQQMREAILAALTNSIFVYHKDPETYRRELQIRMRTLCFSEAAAALDERPIDDNLRKGDFGEIVACEYLRQVEGFSIPVYRLRYRKHHKISEPGEDLIAIKLGEPREVCIGEAKVRAEFESRAVREAYEQIEASTQSRPESLSFMLQVLKDQENWDLFDVLAEIPDRLVPNPFVRRYFILLVCGNRPSDPFRVIQDQEQVVENLVAANISIPDLDRLITILFEAEVDPYARGRAIHSNT